MSEITETNVELLTVLREHLDSATRLRAILDRLLSLVREPKRRARPRARKGAGGR
jgi:hypothetical protein